MGNLISKELETELAEVCKNNYKSIDISIKHTSDNYKEESICTRTVIFNFSSSANLLIFALMQAKVSAIRHITVRDQHKTHNSIPLFQFIYS